MGADLDWCLAPTPFQILCCWLLHTEALHFTPGIMTDFGVTSAVTYSFCIAQVELVLRIVAHGRDFFCKVNFWNWLDTATQQDTARSNHIKPLVEVSGRVLKLQRDGVSFYKLEGHPAVQSQFKKTPDFASLHRIREHCQYLASVGNSLHDLRQGHGFFHHTKQPWAFHSWVFPL